MGQTLSEQIFSNAAGRTVSPGEIVVIRPDVVMSHDSLTPGIIRILADQFGQTSVYDPDQLVFVIDHVAPASTVGTADAQYIVCLLYTSDAADEEDSVDL